MLVCYQREFCLWFSLAGFCGIALQLYCVCPLHLNINFLVSCSLHLLSIGIVFCYSTCACCQYNWNWFFYIQDIAQTSSGNMTITGQWFYRPEEAEKKGGGNWKSRDTRELFYSFHRDDVPAESVMHKCVVHFIPLHKQIPLRKQHPGFIVQRVYDTEQRILFKLTDKDYEDNKQHEIDLLVNKTLARIVDLPDIEPEDNAAVNADQLKNKRLLRKKNMPPLDVSREDEGPGKSQSLKPETPGSTTAIGSE